MKKRKNLPIFLEGYDPLENLVQWREEQSEKIQAHWDLRSFQKILFACCLTWRLETADGSAHLASIQQVATTPEEAVFLAIDQFKKLN